MYYFNHKLIERLPELFQMNRTDFCRMYSLRYGTFLKMEQGDARCSMLVDLCNRLRISMSHFIVTTPEPERMYSLSDYQTPKDKWKDIKWNNRIFATLFRESGITGLYKKVAVSRMRHTNPNTFDYWGENPSAARMDMFIRLLNLKDGKLCETVFRKCIFVTIVEILILFKPAANREHKRTSARPNLRLSFPDIFLSV